MEAPIREEICERIAKIEVRVDELEAAVFRKQARAAKVRAAGSGRTAPSGPSSGVRHLIEKGFFESKRSLREVREALAELGYHYSPQAVDMAIKRMCGRGGPLVCLQEKGKRVFANRK